VLEILITVLQLHSVARRAKGIGRCCMVDRKTSHHGAGTDYRGDEQKCDKGPAVDRHGYASSE